MSRGDLLGATRLIYATTVSVGAGNTQVALRPDVGKCWKLKYAWAYQASGGNRAAQWTWVDPDYSGNLGLSIAALPAATAMPLGSQTTTPAGVLILPQEIWVYRSRYPVWLWTASGAAENGYAYALVEEFQGVLVV